MFGSADHDHVDSHYASYDTRMSKLDQADFFAALADSLETADFIDPLFSTCPSSGTALDFDEPVPLKPLDPWLFATRG